MTKAIYLDMDGTIANLFSVPDWEQRLRAEDVSPYTLATPLINMSLLARYLNKLQKNGYVIGIVSWLSMNGSDEYNMQTAEAKVTWLEKHLPSVHFDEIHITKYGVPKQTLIDHPNGYLFDDDVNNRNTWLGTAYDVDNIIPTLKNLLKNATL